MERTEEHVLQSAFGATAVLPTEVCGGCNNHFSDADKCFIDGVNRWCLGGLSPSHLGYGERPDGHSTVASRLTKDGDLVSLPQFVITSEGEATFHGVDERIFASMLYELRDPGSFVVVPRVLDEPAPACRIIRSAPKKYCVEGSDANRVARVAKDLGARGFRMEWRDEFRASTAAQGAEVYFRLSLDLELFCRAMAKVALNFLCYRLGARLALASELDEVRRFARFGDGECFELCTASLLNHDLTDALAAFVPASHHGILLANYEEAQRVLIPINGRTVGMVRLTRGETRVPIREWILLTSFDPQDRTRKDYRLPDDIFAAVVNPAALGAEGWWPRRAESIS